MKKRGILSVLIIVLAIVAVGGATMAWFTDQSDPIENVFTAGTVEIEAGEVITSGEEKMDNWNPGDCAVKQFTITNKGTKGIALRGEIITEWYKWVGTGEQQPFDRKDADFESNWEVWEPDHDDDPYDTAIEITLDPADQGWVERDPGSGIWYYGDANNDTTIDGTFGGGTPEEVTLTLKVCLNGPKADNQYQGKVFTLTATFQAIQASHSDQWDWDNVDFLTGEELEVD